MNSTAFGNKIYNLRKAKNLTQAQLAEILNVSPKTISRWETGEGYPEISILKPLADALGVTVDDLLSDNINDHNEKASFEQNTNKKEKTHKDIPVDWSRFWGYEFFKSLTIFNKISWVCFGVPVVLIIILIPAGVLLDGDLPFYWASIATVLLTNLPKIGIFSALIGLIAGLLDYYDRQTKTTLIIILLNIAIKLLIPLVFIMVFNSLRFI